MSRRAVALLAALVSMGGVAEPARAETGVRQLAAKAGSSQVTLSGWATFSGAVIATRTDKTGDAGPGGDAIGADLTSADLVYRPELEDFFIRLRLTTIPVVSAGGLSVVGDPTVLYGLRMVVNGVPVEVRIQSLGAAGARFGLFTCESEDGCREFGALAGGFGTTGKELVVALPFSVLAAAKAPIKEGQSVSTPIGFSARLPYDAPKVPPELALDDLALTKAPRVTVPKKSLRVTVGSVTKAAGLKAGKFSIPFSRKAFRGNPATVTTRTCLGSRCVTQKFTVKL